MRRIALGIVVAAALAGCGSDEGGSKGELASLVVTVDEDGAEGPAKPQQLELECQSASDSESCAAAAGISAADLQETGGEVACTQIYGGPQEATIKGTLHGEDVDASFNRSDGCQIARWDEVEVLLAEVS